MSAAKPLLQDAALLKDAAPLKDAEPTQPWDRASQGWHLHTELIHS